MSPDPAFPTPSPDRQGGAVARPAFRSPGLAAMTRRYIDGEIGLRQLLSFDGTTRPTPAPARNRKLY